MIDIDLGKVDPLFKDDSRQMILLYLSKDGVSITKLTDEGLATIEDKEYQAADGQWEDWSLYLGKEEALKQVAEMLDV